MRQEIMNAVAALPADLRCRSGAAFYSGWSALKPGPIYFMGLNPGGDPCNPDYKNIEIVLEGWHDLWSSYVDETWERQTSKGCAPHQKRVRSLIECLNLDPHDVFAANAIFVRTKSAADLGGIWELWRTHFWPIHQNCWRSSGLG